MISVAVVEDFPIVREALVAGIDADPRMRVVHACCDGRALLDQLVMSQVDVALVDMHLPDIAGPDVVARALRTRAGVRVVVLSASRRRALVSSAMRAGASGYLLKSQSIEEVTAGIVTVASGGTVLAPELGAELMGADGHAPSPQLDDISLRILEAVVHGATDDEIASTLFVSTRTVQNHLARLRRSAGVRRRAELARWACDNALA